MAQRRRPPPVVAQGTLGEGREVGHHLLEELVVVHLGAQDVDQHGAHEVVARAHGLGVLVPVRIDAGGHEQALVHEPELPQPVPAPVVGQQRQQVVELGRERVLVVLRRQQPGRRALVHVEVAHLPRQAGDELGGAGPASRSPPRAVRPARPSRPRPPSGTTARRSVSRPARAGNEGRLSWPTAQTIPSNDVGPLGAVAAAHRQRPLPPWRRRSGPRSPRDEKRMHSPSPSSLAIRCR